MIYLKLFISFLQIGMFSFGGGYAAMPLIQGQVVNGHQWLTMAEFTDLITISQMTPGPIAVNSATFVGTKIAGVPGALAATFGCILPSCVIVTLIAKLYLKYRNMALLQGVLASLRPAVVALIGSAGIAILINAFWENSAQITAWNQLDHGGNFCGLCSAAAEGKDESDPGHGAGRSHEGSGGPAHWRIMKIVFILCPKP